MYLKNRDLAWERYYYHTNKNSIDYRNQTKATWEVKSIKQKEWEELKGSIKVAWIQLKDANQSCEKTKKQNQINVDKLLAGQVQVTIPTE